MKLADSFRFLMTRKRRARTILPLLLLILPLQQAFFLGGRQLPRKCGGKIVVTTPRIHTTSINRIRTFSATTTSSSASNNSTNADDASSSSSSSLQSSSSLWNQQAQILRQEIADLQREVEQQKQARLVKAQTDVDRWIAQALVRCQVDADTTLLNTVDETVEILCKDRYSPEQVYKMFRHLSETTSSNKRSQISPTLELLVEAAGKMDALERDENPNKRWSGRIEADFRKRLFARDWGIELEDKDFSGGRW